MKTAKRILAVSLALVLALAVFAFPASALDGTMTFSVSTDNESYAPGDSVTVNIYISSDYNATALRIPVFFSANIFEIPVGGVRPAAYGICSDNKGTLDSNTSESATPIDMSLITDYYDSSAYGVVAIQWTANVTSTEVKSFNSNGESVKCFSFQLKVKADASGEGTILIPNAEELKPAFAFYNQAIVTPTDATTICRVNAVFNTDEWSISIDAGSADGLTTADGSDVVIDYSSKIIKNWFNGMDKTAIQANVVPYGNASLNFRASPSNGWGTGSKVRLLVNGSWVADYTNLLYGDIDGDGTITSFDVSIVKRAVLNIIALDEEIYSMASDIDFSGSIDAFDSSLLSRAALNVITIDQSM